jgi:hypothetical protein
MRERACSQQAQEDKRRPQCDSADIDEHPAEDDRGHQTAERARRRIVIKARDLLRPQ